MLYIQSPESQKQFVCPSFQRVLREKGQTAEDFLTEMAQQSVVTITGDEKTPAAYTDGVPYDLWSDR